jgi:hypothetical protein
MGDGADKRLGRRAFIESAAVTGFAALAAPAIAARPNLWSDRATWGGKLPGRNDIVRIDRTVVLDRNVEVGGVIVRPGGSLKFHPQRSVTLTSTGNIVVKGKLVMRPGRSDVRHAIVFDRVREQRFVGSGHRVLDTDVGLWIMHHGRLDVRGTSKLAWARVSGSAAVGDVAVTLDRDPVGWKPGDEIVIAPTTAPGWAGHRDGFEELRVAAIDGRLVTFDPPLERDHPAVANIGAELLNLTRNVRVGGRRRGRAHLFIHSAHPQKFSHAEIRHVGPRHKGAVSSTSVLGRYALHFHEARSGSKGSLVEGVVVRDAGNHSFVPHTSHGVTFSNCIAYDVSESPYWWDEGDRTNNTLWEDCIAARVRADNPVAANDLTGFFLGRGTANTARRCTSVGVGGSASASGFEWPPKPADGVWTFEDCVAHNNAVHGIFVWQNNNFVNFISGFLAFHNGEFGIKHGAFNNAFRYSELLLSGNGEGGFLLHATSDETAQGDSLLIENSLLDGAGLAPPVVIGRHFKTSGTAVKLVDCRLAHNTEAILVDEGGTAIPGLEDFVRCSVGSEGRDLEPADFRIRAMQPGSSVRVQRQDNQSAYRLDQAGNPMAIPPFD